MKKTVKQLSRFTKLFIISLILIVIAMSIFLAEFLFNRAISNTSIILVAVSFAVMVITAILLIIELNKPKNNKSNKKINKSDDKIIKLNPNLKNEK